MIINCFFSLGSQLQLSCQQIRCLHEISFLFLDEQKNRMTCLPIKIDGIGKNLDKSINEPSVSSISTDWSIQSISYQIRFTDFYRFIDLQMDTDLYRLTTPGVVHAFNLKKRQHLIRVKNDYDNKTV